MGVYIVCRNGATPTRNGTEQTMTMTTNKTETLIAAQAEYNRLRPTGWGQNVDHSALQAAGRRLQDAVNACAADAAEHTPTDYAG